MPRCKWAGISNSCFALSGIAGETGCTCPGQAIPIVPGDTASMPHRSSTNCRAVLYTYVCMVLLGHGGRRLRRSGRGDQRL